jgi:hypothetical protein
MNRVMIAMLVAALDGMLMSHSTRFLDASSARAEITRKVYISAIDRHGAPVTDLTAAEITVKEGGKERTVAGLAPATTPMQVAILIDDEGTGAFQVAVAQFVQKTLGRAQFRIILLNPQASQIVDFTEDVDALKTGIGRLGARGRMQPDGDQILDGIASAAKALRQRKAERPVIVTMTIAGGKPEGIEPTDVLTAVRLSGAQLNVVYVARADLGMVMGDGPQQSGGRIEQAGAGNGIVPAVLRIADALQHQYLLTYTLPDGVKLSDRLNVDTTRKGIALTAPSRIADK